MEKLNFHRVRVGQPTVVDVHAFGRIMDINASSEGCSDESCFEQKYAGGREDFDLNKFHRNRLTQKKRFVFRLFFIFYFFY